MKNIISITAIILFFSFHIFSQGIKQEGVSYKKFAIERLKEIQKSKSDELNELNNKGTQQLISDFSQVNHLFDNNQVEFYEEKELEGNYLRTSITKKQLDNGFLLIEYLTQTWDGSAWLNSQKDSYTYDANNNKIEGIAQTWDGSTRINFGKVSALYDGNNNPIGLLFQTWSGSAWTNDSRYSYTYDGNNNKIEELYQTWDGSAWLNEYRYLCTFNENNKWIEQINQIWADSTWRSYVKISATYNGNNKPIEHLFQVLSDSVWVNDAKYSFAYDGNYNEIESLCQNWSGGAWVNHKKYSFIYNGNNNWIEYRYQTWSGSAWINSWKYSYTYDGNNNSIENLYQTWSGSTWLNNYRYLQSYDGNNNRIESVHQTWFGDWVNDYKYDYSYDGNNNPIECVYQIWSGSIWINTEKYIYTYMPELPVELVAFNAEIVDGNVVLNWSTASETNNNGFEIEKHQKSNVKGQTEFNRIGFVNGKGTTTEKTFYSFTDKNEKPGLYLYRLKQIDFNGNYNYSNEVEIEVAGPKDFALYQNYPNPFNPSTKIKYAIASPNLSKGKALIKVSLIIYDVLGKEVVTLVSEEQSAGNYEVELNLAQLGKISLTSGVYFYRLNAGSFIFTKKLLLLK